MTSKKHIPILLALLLALLPAMTAAADYATPWGVFSSGTTISAKGTGNETVSIEYTTYDDGMAKKTQWVSSQTLNDPSSLSWNSQLDIGTKGDSLWWDFKNSGLPVAWEKTETILPVITSGIQKQIVLPITWKYTLTPTILPATIKKLNIF
jgi:hypothetical protein